MREIYNFSEFGFEVGLAIPHMNIIIIRTCARDDYLARLCYESFLSVGIVGEYSFLAEEVNRLAPDSSIHDKEYEHILMAGVPIYWRPYCDNYGGDRGARMLLDSLQQYTFKDSDTVIISDSDVVVCEPFEHLIKGDHCGHGAIDPPQHPIKSISGQMQIFNGKTINRMLALTTPEIDEIVRHMDEDFDPRLHVTDDRFNSFVTSEWGCEKHLFERTWIHYKFYGLKDSSYLEALMIAKESQQLYNTDPKAFRAKFPVE